MFTQNQSATPTPLSNSNLNMLFFFFFLFLFQSPAAALTAPSDIEALLALKSAVSAWSIKPYSCLASWDFSSDPCRPSTPTHFVCGLACSPDGDRVTAVTLDPAGYSAAAIPSQLGNLTRLFVLDLANNAFRGAVPSLAALSALRVLVLASNSLSGAVPAGALANLSSLETLDLSRNSLSGPLPRSLSALVSLRTLDLSFNRLSGPLPASFPPALVELALRGNSLSGPLRRSGLEGLKFLEVAELSMNRIDGKLEAWLLRLPSLQQVDLANNSLSGFAVGSRGGGDRLVALDLGFNRIEGELPAGFAEFPSLVALSVRHNRIRGMIPSQYTGAKKGSPFRRLFLDGNYLKGRVPVGMLGDVAGSVGDNCLQGCPSSLPLCSPVQKPDSVCRQMYGAGTGNRTFG